MMKKELLLIKQYPIQDLSEQTIRYFRSKWSKSIAYFRPKRLIEHTLLGSTYLYTRSQQSAMTKLFISRLPLILRHQRLSVARTTLLNKEMVQASNRRKVLVVGDSLLSKSVGTTFMISCQFMIGVTLNNLFRINA